MGEVLSLPTLPPPTGSLLEYITWTDTRLGTTHDAIGRAGRRGGGAAVAAVGGGTSVVLVNVLLNKIHITLHYIHVT